MSSLADTVDGSVVPTPNMSFLTCALIGSTMPSLSDPKPVP